MDQKNVWNFHTTPLRSTLASLYLHFHQGTHNSLNQNTSNPQGGALWLSQGPLVPGRHPEVHQVQHGGEGRRLQQGHGWLHRLCEGLEKWRGHWWGKVSTCIMWKHIGHDKPITSIIDSTMWWWHPVTIRLPMCQPSLVLRGSLAGWCMPTTSGGDPPCQDDSDDD